MRCSSRDYTFIQKRRWHLAFPEKKYVMVCLGSISENTLFYIRLREWTLSSSVISLFAGFHEKFLFLFLSHRVDWCIRCPFHALCHQSKWTMECRLTANLVPGRLVLGPSPWSWSSPWACHNKSQSDHLRRLFACCVKYEMKFKKCILYPKHWEKIFPVR